MEKVTTKEIVQKYNFKFTKSLGQNFLTDQTVLDDIVIGSEVCEEDFVIEIGPGVGTLTKELLKKARKVCAVELDSNLIPILQEELKEFDNFQLIHKDALKINFKELIGDEKSVKVVANLPYYVTTPIIARSEEHTSELQSRQYLVCRLLLEKKKQSSSTNPFSLSTSTTSPTIPLTISRTTCATFTSEQSPLPHQSHRHLFCRIMLHNTNSFF